MQLSARSRMTSSSYSFHPTIERSTSTSRTGLASMPASANEARASASAAIPEPEPPRMKLGRMITGNPIPRAISCASATEWAKPDSGTSRPMSPIARLNSSRSSAVAIASGRAPITSTPNRSNTPVPASAMVRLRAVWPPSVGNNASGRSRSMIASTTAGSSGST